MAGQVLVLIAVLLVAGLLALWLRSERVRTERLIDEGEAWRKEMAGPLEPDSEFGPLRRVGLSHIKVTIRLPCPPYGELEVDLRTRDRLRISEPTRATIRALRMHWPAFWDAAKEALQEEVERYGYSEAWSNCRATLSHELLDEYSADSEVHLGLEFEPFAGYYDVTFKGDTVLDSGAAF